MWILSSGRGSGNSEGVEDDWIILFVTWLNSKSSFSSLLEELKLEKKIEDVQKR